jgi:hypothetical protein
MSAGDWSTPGEGLVIPFGAGDTTPRVVIGSPASGVIPADLIAYYAPFGEVIIAGIVEFTGTGTYTYQVFIIDGGGSALPTPPMGQEIPPAWYQRRQDTSLSSAGRPLTQWHSTTTPPSYRSGTREQYR